MSNGDTSYDRVNDYAVVRISLASPQDIRSWSFGEVKKPETINYRTSRPVRDGLFCERIFGPVLDWECACGKSWGVQNKGKVCKRCGVKVTHSKARRQRFGHIELAAPVVHVWFLKARPSRLGTLLGMKVADLEKVVYFQGYVVIDPGDTALKKYQLLTEEDSRQAREQYGDAFEADMGAEAVKRLLEGLDLVDLARELRQRLDAEGKRSKPSRQRLGNLRKRLKVVEDLRNSGKRPEWMVLECVPVIPPDLRPMVLLKNGNFGTSDLNDLYRRIINCNNSLNKVLKLKAPEVIIRDRKRMLQQAVDALFDNNHCKVPVRARNKRPLKSLTDMIKGKEGRFRENLLGKRVDYSARSVIVAGPELKLHQCGLPRRIALELFKPFIVRRLKERGHADTIKSAKKMLERKDEQVLDILEEVIKDHPVLLNRAPTLHRMSIQAFEPVLIEDKTIRLHPLVCKGFNADFDGDQMAVHLPLSIEAQVEATLLMMSTNNIFSPANGQLVFTPSQDIVMGCYYLTATRGELGESGEAGEGKVFAGTAEVHAAYEQKKLGVHARIHVRLPMDKRVITEVRYEKDKTRVEEVGRKPNGLVPTTVGRVLFNDILSPRMAYYDLALSSKHLARIIADCYQQLGRRETIDLLDRMKELGFRESTRSGLSFGTDDLKIPTNKEAVLKATEQKDDHVRQQYDRGKISDSERHNKITDLWTHARDEISKQMMEDLKNDRRDGTPYLNPVFLMAHSGARGGIEQIRQLAGMRGLMPKPKGTINAMPIKANFREGLSVLEYFSSTPGARKGLADTALNTKVAGYLSRKLADVAQNVVVTLHDCGTTQGVSKGVVLPYQHPLSPYRRGAEFQPLLDERPLSKSICGRVSRNTITNPMTDEVVVHENEMITREAARKIEQMGLKEVWVRSPMSCQAPLGVCRLCYGMDLATGALVEEGLAVGIIAAQSIGEPGTQLTLRTFHTGGAASSQDITSGLPQVTRLFEARRPRNPAVLAGVAGVVSLGGEKRGKRVINVQPLDEAGSKVGNPVEHIVPAGEGLCVQDGDRVKEGDRLVLGTPDPHDVLRILGIEAVGQYLVQEVQSVYRSQRVEIDDKHVEVIVTQMLRKVQVKTVGDTGLLPDSMIDKFAFRAVNDRLRECVKVQDPGDSKFEADAVVTKQAFEEERTRVEAEGKALPTWVDPKSATAIPVLLGITKAAVQSDSFISAASFQETTKVLTEAALAGKIDSLVGLKENVILGRLVPAGTGFHSHQDAEVMLNAPAAEIGSAGADPVQLAEVG